MPLHQRSYLNFLDMAFDLGDCLDQSEKPVIAAIAGSTCTGKSLAARRLRNDFPGQVAIVGLDSYFRDGTDTALPHDRNGNKVFDLPESYHGDQFIAAVNDLYAGRDAVCPIYDKALSKRLDGQSQTVAAAPIIIAEGLYAIELLAGSGLPVIRVFMHADKDVIRRRLIARNSDEFGMPANKTRERFRTIVQPYLARVDAQKEGAEFFYMSF